VVLSVNILHHDGGCAEVTNVKIPSLLAVFPVQASVVPTLRKTGEGWGTHCVMSPALLLLLRSGWEQAIQAQINGGHAVVVGKAAG